MLDRKLKPSPKIRVVQQNQKEAQGNTFMQRLEAAQEQSRLNATRWVISYLILCFFDVLRNRYQNRQRALLNRKPIQQLLS